MSLSHDFSEAVLAYRKRAADRFARRDSITRSPPHRWTSPSLFRKPYQRALFPALIDYLSQAAAAYRQWKLSPPATRIEKVKNSGGALGHGELVMSLAADVRREKWLLACRLERHKKRAVIQHLRDVVVACGIPEDIRSMWSERFLTRAKKDWIKVTFTGIVGGKKEGDVLAYDAEDESGYAVHVTRCRDASRKGCKMLIRQGEVDRRDTFEEVRKLYMGKPDEIYRRQTARKFARYRREKREREAESLKQSTRAEMEMKRRRGHDHLLTARGNGDASFAPFLFELDSNAYAFSSKITDAPKLRKVMIEKYSKDDNGANNVNGWQKAQQAAETNPLFHTRVMNRFM
eukprot:GFKZ01005061.1.p2 GENE.GFKZ01005061.1~~GFKZ01005061.1.p2  ORF type:complete len:371 (+),score=59.91 GFKZ01005061.1:77-1114(+)